MSVESVILARFNYWIFLILMMVGLYAVMAKANLVKKLIGLSIFQTAIILFFVSIGARRGGTIPILEHGTEAALGAHAAHLANPLPHVLMLTAIVVGVAVMGVALALVERIYQQHGTLEEPEILEQLRG